MDEIHILNDILGEINKQDSKVKIALLSSVVKATGLVFSGARNGSYKKEAEKYLMEQIKNDEKMPLMLKAAAISNVNKVLKEYVNQNDIINKALEYMDDNARPEEIDSDWLSFFFDNAKHVKKDDVKIIWSRVLAKKCEDSKSISKRLIQILSTISNFEAEAFTNLCKFSYYIKKDDDKCYQVLYKIPVNQDLYDKEGIEAYKILRLLETGLIRADYVYGYSIDCNEFLNIDGSIEIFHYDKSFKFIPNNAKQLKIGNVAFTAEGSALIDLIQQPKINEFFNCLITYYSEQGKIS